MKTEKIHIVLIQNNPKEYALFRKVFSQIKIENTLILFQQCEELMQYLTTGAIQRHLLIFDLGLPDRSGIDCIKEVKQNPDLKSVVTALYTPTSAPEIVEEAFLAGTNIYLTKPATMEEFNRMLTEAIYMTWQYFTDGLDLQHFMKKY